MRPFFCAVTASVLTVFGGFLRVGECEWCIGLCGVCCGGAGCFRRWSEFESGKILICGRWCMAGACVCPFFFPPPYLKQGL